MPNNVENFKEKFKENLKNNKLSLENGKYNFEVEVINDTNYTINQITVTDLNIINNETNTTNTTNINKINQILQNIKVQKTTENPSSSKSVSPTVSPSSPKLDEEQSQSPSDSQTNGGTNLENLGKELDALHNSLNNLNKPTIGGNLTNHKKYSSKINIKKRNTTLKK